MKKIVCIILLIVISLPAAYFDIKAYSISYDNIDVKINFSDLPLRSPAVVIDGTTMVPVCQFASVMWYSVDWNIGDNKFKMSRSSVNKELIWQMDSNVVNVNGKDMTVTGTPEVINNVVYIPLRGFCDAAGMEIEYNEVENTVYFYTDAKEIMQKIETIDSWCNDGVLDFILSLYDSETGLFYYSISARDNSQFGPGIESTYQALSLLEKGMPQGLKGDFYSSLPIVYKEKVIKTLQSWQSAEDGYFYVPWQPIEQTDAKRERDLSAATNLLTKLGGEALYPLPNERFAKETYALSVMSTDAVSDTSHYDSEEQIKVWLDNLDWSNPYGALHQISSSFSMIKSAGLGDFVRNYVTQKQNQQTGLWGDGLNYNATDAALKASALYDKEHPYPNFEKMVESTLTVITGETPADTVCAVWNPLSLLNNASDTYGYTEFSEERKSVHNVLADIIDITTKNIEPFKCSDGGLSYYENYTPHKVQGSDNGLGLKEGNTDHTLIGTFLLRNSLLELANGSVITPVFEGDMDKINSVLLNSAPIQKKERVIGCDKDFEDCTPGEPLPWDVINTCYTGNVEISKDPYRLDNNVIKLASVPGGTSSFQIIAQSYDNSKKIVFETDFCIESIAKGSSGFNEIGYRNAAQWSYTSADGETWSFGYRTNPNGVGTIIKDNLQTKKWYRIKMVYEPAGTDNTYVSYYIDDVLVAKNKSYYNGGNVDLLPEKRVERLVFNPFMNSEAVMYFDNIKMTAQ